MLTDLVFCVQVEWSYESRLYVFGFDLQRRGQTSQLCQVPFASRSTWKSKERRKWLRIMCNTPVCMRYLINEGRLWGGYSQKDSIITDYQLLTYLLTCVLCYHTDKGLVFKTCLFVFAHTKTQDLFSLNYILYSCHTYWTLAF